ncbi:MAG: MBL fold metallo-hydrolase [Proteobacteria bacterium]|nr:MBL fold metallo-hydrolase [Pseudomonadota bacterium]MBU4383924.1 MBL fold metallo-hydrolase [Pseudomonadota bacterium]MCG2763564.1 MBL fold metallo-hydrolase [Desulfarculaceae bacterium]
MGEIIETSKAIFNGELDSDKHHPFGKPYGIEQVAEGTWFYKGFSNTIIRETDDGLIMVDPSSAFDIKYRLKAVSSVTEPRLNTAIFTHGHVDHAFGMKQYIEVAEERKWPRPRAIAHEAMPGRFARYLETGPFNEIINSRQFAGGDGRSLWPKDFYMPDILYRDGMVISVGGVRAELHHDRGETDDATWVYFPDTRVLATGDLFLWTLPNAGNPQKVQRYAKDWAIALRKMVAKEVEILCPGHGWVIFGAENVRRALSETAELLETVYQQTVEMMNKGADLNTIVNTVRVPGELTSRPYLRPLYDEPEFLARNIWRLLGGWYDGVPSNLKPAPLAEQGAEIARLAGGADKLAARALELSQAGKHRLACHLADWAKWAEPEDRVVAKTARQVYTSRAENENSTMSKGIFMAAAREADGGIVEDKVMSGTSSIIRAQNS